MRMGKYGRGAIVIVAAFLLLAATGCFVYIERGDRTAPQFATHVQLSKNPNSSAPLAAVVRFCTDEPTETVLHISDGEHRWTLTYGPDSDPEDGLPVVGMRPDRTHTIEVVVRDEHGNVRECPRALEYKTPPLPQEVEAFPDIKTTVHEKAAMEPGLTLFNPRRRVPGETVSEFNKNFGLLVAIDAQGQVVWYYRTDSRISDFQFLENGNIAYITTDNRLTEIDLLGNVQRQWYAAGRPEGEGDGTPVDTLTFHHSFYQMPDGNFLILGTDRRKIEDYYTSEWDADAPREDQWVMGDEIVEFRPDGEVVWRWNAFEHMDPRRIGYLTFSGYWKRRGWPKTVDWSHANNVEYLADEDAVLCNFRLQSAVVKIDRETGDIPWIAGEHSGWPERLQDRLLELKDADRWFWHQHDAKFTERGTLLVFDNDNFEARPFDEPEPPAEIHSRIAEYRVDEQKGTLRWVWTSEQPDAPQHASWAMGSVQYLPEKDNVLAGYGFMILPEDLKEMTWKTRLSFKGWTRTAEYSHTDPPEPVWEMRLRSREPEGPIGWTCFGAARTSRLLSR